MLINISCKIIKIQIFFFNFHMLSINCNVFSNIVSI